LTGELRLARSLRAASAMPALLGAASAETSRQVLPRDVHLQMSLEMGHALKFEILAKVGKI
jgi:hypothetical protein